MIKYMYIGLGGAAGAVLRYLATGLAYRIFNEGFPWGTLIVNLIGSLIIGLLWGLFENITVSQNIKLLILVGLLGAFTTFSTFSLENFNLLREGQHLFFALNIIVSVICGLLLVFAGYTGGKIIIDFLK